MNPTAPKTRPPAARRKGFTLIELLTVIMIIVILMGILMPTIQGVRRAGYAAKCRTLLGVLESGIQTYYSDQAQYPGQINPGIIGGGDTGSQVLAQGMFTKKDGTGFPTEGYAPLNADVLAEINGQGNTISDQFPRPMAVCYYVSRPGQSGLGQFVYADNNLHTNGKTGPTSFSDFIKDRRFKGDSSTTPYRDGEYLLIAPGPDRKYFTSDDVKNWN